MVLLRSFIIWLLIVLVEFIQGAIRELFLVPFIGELGARQVGVFTGSVIILMIATLFIRWIRAANIYQLLAIGFFWLILMLGFEISFGRFILGFSWERIASDYNLLEGGFLSLGMLVLAAAPLIAAKTRQLI
jgi:hypothetical protein